MKKCIFKKTIFPSNYSFIRITNKLFLNKLYFDFIKCRSSRVNGTGYTEVTAGKVCRHNSIKQYNVLQQAYHTQKKTGLKNRAAGKTK
jgi:hypothetical protein